jgi:dCMP deaminase
VTWDEYGIAEARLAAAKSKDPSTGCGAAVFSPKNRLISKGWNGFPRGVADDPVLLADRATKYELVIHAEVNAILFAGRELDGCTIYVWPMPPCSRCASVIAQSGIKRVVAPVPSSEHRERWGWSLDLARWVYEQAGIEYCEIAEVADD